MKILFIIQKLYNGGAEHAVARISSELSKRHDVYLALTDPDPYLKGKYETDPKVHILHAKPVTLNEKWGPIYKFVRETTAVRKLRRIKKKYAFDVSVSFLTSPNYYNVKSSCGEPTVISIRNMMSRAKFKSKTETAIRGYYGKYAAEHASCLVTVSQNVGRDQMELFSLGKARIRTIYNALDPEEVKEKAAGPVIDEKFMAFRRKHENLLVTIGRLTEQKAQWQLIRCMKEILIKHPSTGLIIFGMGEMEGQLKNTISQNGLEDHVYLAGYQIEPFNCMEKADVFVMTSLWEGFSNAMLEAMACGLPIVSTDGLSGPRELLSPGTDPASRATDIEYAAYGILTPPFSGNMGLCTQPLEDAERMFAEAVTTLLSDPAKKEFYRKQGHARLQDFTMEKISGQWEKLFYELVPQKNRKC